MRNLPHAAIERLDYYVYLYVDPRNDQVFYVGKGKGNRASVTWKIDQNQSRARLSALKRSFQKEKSLVSRFSLMVYKDEEEALRIEAAVIDLLGKEALTNDVRGYGSCDVGRIPLEELIHLYAAEPAETTHPALLIRINKLYRYDMNNKELYEATRGVWRVDEAKIRKVKYVLAVFRGTVREVYAVDRWDNAEQSQWPDSRQKEASSGRYAFTGSVADPSIRERYLYKSVEAYFPHGAQNPIRYIFPTQ